MKQTSRAVALLLVLESANAVGASAYLDNTIAATALKITAWGTVDIINNFNKDMSYISGTPASALTNRTDQYMQVPALWSWSTLTTKLSLWPVGQLIDNAANTTTAGSSCMGCLNKSGVWCSRTYAYLSTAAAGLQANSLVFGSFMTVDASPDSAKRLGGAGMDGGSCCASSWLMNQLVGSPSVAGQLPTYDNADTVKTGTDITTSGTGTVAPQMTKIACVAAANLGFVDNVGATAVWGPLTWDVSFAVWTSWWCSNGLYKQVGVASSGGIFGNFNQQIASNTNKRLELAQVACPQIDTHCGYGVTVSAVVAPTVVGSDITSGAVAFTVAGTATPTLLTYVGKCTWVAYAYAKAPTFAVTQSTSAGLSSNWELHTMEYVTNASTITNGRLLEASNTTGLNVGGNDSVNANFVPLFQMPATAFSQLRTWYGAGTFNLVGTEPGNWYAPGQNASTTSLTTTTTAVALQLATASTQYYGNVASFPQATFYSVTTASQVVPAGSTYGLAGTTKFDLRQVRFLPASAAQNVWAAGSTLNTTYSTNVTAYTTAKGVWDAYVAILTANGKQDAFAAMFSPPKAPTVPPLPNMPWTPPAYTGLMAVGNGIKTQMLNNGLGTTDAFTSTSNPAAGAFWTNQAAAASVGGWGIFTAQILSFRNAFGKSFGTIGFSGDAKAQLMSQVWNMPWMCMATDTTVAIQADTNACQASYSAVANGAAGTASATAVNASGTAAGGRLVVVVSLWSKGDQISAGPAVPTAATFAFQTGTQDLTVTFTSNVWSTDLQALAAITAPGAPAAAATLSGIAGAQALAASTAAALAVAAALY